MAKINSYLFNNTGIEVATKYLYLFLSHTIPVQNHGLEIELNNEELSEKTALSLGQLYRARSQLVKLGLLIHKKKFCESTGKKIKDIYVFM